MVIQIGKTTGALLLLYWHVLSPHLILPVKTSIIFKWLNEACKGITFRNVKRVVVKTRPVNDNEERAVQQVDSKYSLLRCNR